MGDALLFGLVVVVCVITLIVPANMVISEHVKRVNEIYERIEKRKREREGRDGKG